MDAGDREQGLRRRLSRQGEEALGRLAEELAGSPLVAGAVGRAVEAREKALQAQEAAMGALGLPSAADIERLTRRLRSVSQRLEGIEDQIDGLDERLAGIQGAVEGLSELEALEGERRRLDAVEERVDALAGGEGAEDPTGLSVFEERLEAIAADLAAVRDAVGAAPEVPSRSQERLAVGEGGV
jgi:archaellum component FlaC